MSEERDLLKEKKRTHVSDHSRNYPICQSCMQQHNAYNPVDTIQEQFQNGRNGDLSNGMVVGSGVCQKLMDFLQRLN